MPAQKLSDEEWLAAWKECGASPAAMAKATGIALRNIYYRRDSIALRHTTPLPSNANPYSYHPRLKIDGFVGSIVIFSDCHWWPDISKTPAFAALLEVVKEIKPALIVGNGDLLDAARISRFGRIGWDRTPKLPDELEDVKARCAEVRHCHRGARLIRTIGNHDIRYDSWLASKAADFEGIGGFRLSDHLSEWEETQSIWVNDSIVIKHRWHGGINAARNNTLKSGKTFVSGHTHVLETEPYNDYNGLRWGVQDGTLAEPLGPQFAYGEDNPSQANSGFVVLTIDRDGLHDPEICRVRDGVAYFRGQRVVGLQKKNVGQRRAA